MQDERGDGVGPRIFRFTVIDVAVSAPRQKFWPSPSDRRRSEPVSRWLPRAGLIGAERRLLYAI